MMVLRLAFWPIIILILSGSVFLQYFLFENRPTTRGYPPQPAMMDTYDIYTQLTDNPRLASGIDQVQHLVKEKGQLTHFSIHRAKRGEDETPTTVTVGVVRNGLKYQEHVSFDDDGTFLEIISTALQE